MRSFETINVLENVGERQMPAPNAFVIKLIMQESYHISEE